MLYDIGTTNFSFLVNEYSTRGWISSYDFLNTKLLLIKSLSVFAKKHQ